jgi:hypothetical protein
MQCEIHPSASGEQTRINSILHIDFQAAACLAEAEVRTIRIHESLYA